MMCTCVYIIERKSENACSSNKLAAIPLKAKSVSKQLQPKRYSSVWLIYSSPLYKSRKSLTLFLLILEWWKHLFLSCKFSFLSLRGQLRLRHTRCPPLTPPPPLVPANKPGTIAALASTPKPPAPPTLPLPLGKTNVCM